MGLRASAELERMSATFAEKVKSGFVPGLVTLVAAGDDVRVDAHGVLEQGGSSPMQRDTLFRVASMTKPIAAVSALVLVEEGKLELDAPVDRFLPELADRKVLRRVDGPLDDTVKASRAITLRDLLTFRLGFGMIWEPHGTLPIQRAADELDLMAFGPPMPKRQPEPDTWMKRFGTLPLMHQPGERWRYNTGAEVLGVLIARASGRSLPDFLTERVLAPLGMHDTSFSVPSEKIDRLATSYFANERGGLDLYDPGRGGQWSLPPAFPSAGGGLVSTVDDILAFGRMLLNNGAQGSKRILSPELVKAMLTDQITPEEKAASENSLDPAFWATHGWGFGISIVTGPDAFAKEGGRFGWDGGLGTSWYSDPKKDLTAVLMTQRSEYPARSEVYRTFWSSVYRAVQG